MAKTKAKKRSTARFAGPWRFEVDSKGYRQLVDANGEFPLTLKNGNLILTTPELLEHLETLTKLAKLVVANWSAGNLADAVNCLEEAANDAAEIITKATNPTP